MSARIEAVPWPRVDESYAEYLEFRSAWNRFSHQLHWARMLAGVDIPSSSVPPYSVAQLLSWGQRQLERLGAVASDHLHDQTFEATAAAEKDKAAAPTTAVLLSFSMDTLKSLHESTHTRALDGVTRLTARLHALQPEAAICDAPGWAALPNDLRELLFCRHGPRALTRRVEEAKRIEEDMQLEEKCLCDHVAAIRAMRSVLDKLDHWDALTEPAHLGAKHSREVVSTLMRTASRQAVVSVIQGREACSSRSAFSVTTSVLARGAVALEVHTRSPGSATTAVRVRYVHLRRVRHAHTTLLL